MEEDFRTERQLYLLRRISLNLTEQLELNLKNGNISGIQVYFLVYLLRHHPEGSYLTELCREIGVSKSTLSVLIKKLRIEGYLCFQENPEDIRKKKVLPTEKLNAEKEQFLCKALQAEKEIGRALEGREWEQLCLLEQKLLAQLGQKEHGEMRTDRRYLNREKSFTTAETV
ncbi:MAG TPA: MarR family transcriptional regulator [Candidatus Pullilachnospira intestinigallinarum]|nr:MarR family transcriptional regulator [Candidatus Pullilachnospira intestinigallinarum]